MSENSEQIYDVDDRDDETDFIAAMDKKHGRCVAVWGHVLTALEVARENDLYDDAFSDWAKENPRFKCCDCNAQFPTMEDAEVCCESARADLDNCEREELERFNHQEAKAINKGN